MEPCEHQDGNYMGKCAICEDMVCGECFQTLFNAMICGQHQDLEDESAWELVGFYTNAQVVEERRYTLQEHSMTSIAVETEEDIVELWVPAEGRDEAVALLSGIGEEAAQCVTCSVVYDSQLGACPVCGVKEIS